MFDLVNFQILDLKFGFKKDCESWTPVISSGDCVLVMHIEEEYVLHFANIFLCISVKII